jgi:hypothetical protein
MTGQHNAAKRGLLSRIHDCGNPRAKHAIEQLLAKARQQVLLLRLARGDTLAIELWTRRGYKMQWPMVDIAIACDFVADITATGELAAERHVSTSAPVLHRLELVRALIIARLQGRA